MFKALKILVWTGIAVGAGLYLSTLKFDGKPAVDHLKLAWKQHSSSGAVAALKAKIDDAMGEAQDAIPSTKPKEHHSNEDRDAVNKLIATHGGQKG